MNENRQTNTTAAEWARNVSRRQDRAEASDTMRFGKWVQREDPETGDVWLTAPGREPHLLTPAPPDDDAVLGVSTAPLFAAHRTDTDAANASSGFNPMPADWYDEPESLPGYWSWDSASNTLTVDTAQRVRVQLGQAINPSLIGDRSFHPVVLLNGTEHRVGQVAPFDDQLASGLFHLHFVVEFNVAANDGIAPGYHCTSSPAAALTADEDGLYTRFEVTSVFTL